MTGTAFGSYPVAEDGTFKFWVFADAYKATVTKESCAEVEEDIYESNNLGLVSVRGGGEEARPWPRAGSTRVLARKLNRGGNLHESS